MPSRRSEETIREVALSQAANHPDMLDHLPAFRRHLAHRSPRTQKTYGAIVASFFAFLARAGASAPVPTRPEIETFLARPRLDGRRRAAAGRNQELAALRAFVKFARRDLAWTENPTDGIPFAREASHEPAVLSISEVRRLFTTAAETAREGERARDLALLAVLGQAGLRVHELVALDLEQPDLASATLVGVEGKGGTVHDLPLSPPTVTLLAAYLPERKELAEPGETALFVSSRGTRLSVRTVERLLERLRRAMGTAKHITPHTLRHTTATLALTLGSDISTVAEILRHSDLNTTRRYLHLIDERRREAVGRLATAIPESLLPTAPAAHAPVVEVASVGLGPANDAGAAALCSPRPPPADLDVQEGLDDMNLDHAA